MPPKKKPPLQRVKRSVRIPRAGTGPRIRWTGFRPFFDYWGNEIKRFYQLETLASATEYMIEHRDQFIVPSVKTVMGPSPLTSLHFELFQEGRHQLIFRLQAGNTRRKQGAFGFVAAKNAQEHAEVARQEHRILEELHRRAPQFVVRPFRGGKVFLPDRHGRESHGREIYAYITEWLNGYHELGVNRNLQFFLNTLKPHTLSLAQTELLKGQIVEIMARTYDAEKRNAMAVPEIASGDFVVTHPDRGPLRLKLIACRRIVNVSAPARYLHQIATASWEWGDTLFRICPDEPETFFQGLKRAVGAETARLWISQYLSLVRRGTVKDPLPEFTEALAAFGL